MPFISLETLVHKYGTHVAPPTFIQEALSKYPPQPEPSTPTDRSVLIAKKEYRSRTRQSVDCSYLVSSDGIEFIGKRIKTIEAPSGSFFKVKLSEDDQGKVSAFKTCSIFLKRLMSLSQYPEDADNENVILQTPHIEALFEYLKIPINPEIKIKTLEFFKNLHKKKPALALLCHIPLKNLQDFFNNPITPPPPEQQNYLISYLLDLKQEYIILKRLNRLHGAFLYQGKKGEPKFAITMLNIEGIDFFSFQSNEKHWLNQLPWDEKTDLFRKILQAYQEWCTNSIINHGDIKPENIMIFKDQLRLIDGNFSYTEEDLEQDNIVRSGIRGTPAYMAPELFSAIPPSASREAIRKRLQAADIYALGIFMISLMVIHNPQYPEPQDNPHLNGHQKQMAHYSYILKVLAKMPSASLIIEPRLQAQQERAYIFLGRMVSDNPMARPTSEEAISFFEALQAEPNTALTPAPLLLSVYNPDPPKDPTNFEFEYGLPKKSACYLL